MDTYLFPGLDIPDTVLAYCAGVIDSDGTIGIKRNSYAMRVTRDCSQPTYSERVCVKQVEPHAIELLHAYFRGYKGVAAPSAKRGKPLHVWQVTDKRAARCLKLILPFLRIKRTQAEVCLQLRALKYKSAHRNHHIPRPTYIGEQMETLKMRIHTLNRTGIAI